MGKHYEEMPDPEDIKKILVSVRKEIPGMIREVVDVLYSEKSAKNMGRAVGAYYKTLVQSGIPKDLALEMTKGYVLNINEMFKKQNWGNHEHH